MTAKDKAELVEMLAQHSKGLNDRLDLLDKRIEENTKKVNTPPQVINNEKPLPIPVMKPNFSITAGDIMFAMKENETAESATKRKNVFIPELLHLLVKHGIMSLGKVELTQL